MGIFIGIRIGMVHTVHNSVSPRAEVRRPLRDKSENEEKTLPALAHGKGAMGGIPMLEKGLREKR